MGARAEVVAQCEKMRRRGSARLVGRLSWLVQIAEVQMSLDSNGDLFCYQVDHFTGVIELDYQITINS